MILTELFEQIYARTHLYEMSALANIEPKCRSKRGMLCLFVYNKEYLNEEPHINIGPEMGVVWAKISIPENQPTDISQIKILKYNDKYIKPDTDKFKQQILDWYNSPTKRGGTFWQFAMNSWEAAVAAKRINQIGKP